MNNTKNLLLISSIGLCLGAVLPWATMTSIFGQMTITGLDGDGIITGAIGVILLIVAALAKGELSRNAGIAGLILCLLALWVLFPKYAAFNEVVADLEIGFGSIGIGLHISVLAALLGIFTGFRAMRNSA